MFDSNSDQTKSSSSSTGICSWRPDYELTTESARQWKQASDKQRQVPFNQNADGTYTVVFGDSLSTIAERTLKAQNDSNPTSQQIQEEINAYVKLNDGQYKSLDCNRDFIRTGWRLKVPGAPQEPGSPQPPAEPPAPPEKPPFQQQPAPPPEQLQPSIPPSSELFPPEMVQPGQWQPPSFMPPGQGPININVNIYDVNSGCGHGGGCCCCCGGQGPQPYYIQQPYMPMQQQWYPQPQYNYGPPSYQPYQIPIQPPGYVWANPPEPGYRPRPYQALPGRASWGQVAPEFGY